MKQNNFRQLKFAAFLIAFVLAIYVVAPPKNGPTTYICDVRIFYDAQFGQNIINGNQSESGFFHQLLKDTNGIFNKPENQLNRINGRINLQYLGHQKINLIPEIHDLYDEGLQAAMTVPIGEKNIACLNILIVSRKLCDENTEACGISTNGSICLKMMVDDKGVERYLNTIFLSAFGQHMMNIKNLSLTLAHEVMHTLNASHDDQIDSHRAQKHGCLARNYLMHSQNNNTLLSGGLMSKCTIEDAESFAHKLINFPEHNCLIKQN